VERKIVELGLESRVIVVGFQADVRPFVAACDVMALVSHAVETFSLATLEAMALGRPVVMSRIGGAEEQVTEGHNGYTYPAGDIDELTTCLGRLVDPVECARMGTNAREVVTCKFGVEKMVHEYQNLLRLPNAWLGRPRS
jgi:L-malate glycosyltransferase